MNDDDMFEKSHINLVDFGFATSYLADGKKEHIQKSEVAFFRGNFIFSSINQLKYRTTSRRDDIHSLFYLIVYLLNKGHLQDFEQPLNEDPKKRLQ